MTVLYLLVGALAFLAVRNIIGLRRSAGSYTSGLREQHDAHRKTHDHQTN